MKVNLEISYYPLQNDFIPPIDGFIESLKNPETQVSVGKLSTLLTGEYLAVMSVLTDSMDKFMKEYPSVFNIKITNAAPED